MADPRTIQVPINTPAQTAEYQLAPGVLQYVESVVATVDTSGSGSVTPVLTIAEQSGVVVADKQQQIEHLLIKFTQTLDELPQEQKDKLVNAETAASGILNGATVEGKYHPGLIEKFQIIRDNETGEVYHVGQVIWLNGNPNIVTGINKDTGTVQTQAARRK